MTWETHIDYDEGRLGHASIFGLKSREAAIEWLSHAFVWELCWHMSPSCWIRRSK